MKQRSLLVVSAAILAGSITTTSRAQSSNLQQIVDQFYPIDRLAPDADDARRSCYAVYSKLPSGSPDTIVVGYTDLSNGALRVLKSNGTGFSVVAESDSDLALSGIDCDLDLVDVNNDAQPDIVLSLSAQRGSEEWVFQWSGADLSNMTPTENSGFGLVDSLLSNSSIEDIYHDGTLQVIVPDGAYPGDDLPRTAPDQVFRLSGGRYLLERYIVDAHRFVAGRDPRSWRADFTLIHDSIGPYRLRVINGDKVGAHRVSTCSIKLNGTELFQPGEITAATEFADSAMSSLPVTNTLVMNLGGAAGAYVTVVVEDSTVR